MPVFVGSGIARIRAAAAIMKHVLILAGVLGTFYFLARETVWYGPYIYDEADYMYAVSLGWRANWMDSPGISLPAFVQVGLHRGPEAGQQTELSEMIRNSNDVVFYRHWHGPMYTDWLRFLRQFARDERSTRTLGRVFPVATAILLYFGALWVLPGAGGQIAAIAGPVLYLWSFPVVRTVELAPHQLFAGCVVAALLLLVKMQQASSARPYWYGAAAATGVAFCVLEVGVALILTVLVCGYLGRDRLRPDLPFVAKSIGAFLAPILIIWPAAVFKLSFVKAYLFMAYLVVFRKGAWGNDVSLSETWRLRFVNSPVPWILFLAGIGFFFLNRRKAVLIPFAAFSMWMFLALFPVNTDSPRYALPLLPGVVLLGATAAGLWVAHWSSAQRAAAAVAICASMLATSWPPVRSRMPVPNRRADAILALVRDQGLGQEILLVPHGDLPMLHYYFPESRFRTYTDERTIEQDVRSRVVDGVLYADPPRLVPVALRTLIQR
jgi:hypothetical protein